MRVVRNFSSEAPKIAAAPVVKSGGSTFFQRFTSFLAGTGVGFGVSYYFIYCELIDSNNHLERKIAKIPGYKE
eukprot:CAMPEP_0184994754 /NCGR_PEP_ID=MMETSP1098-20130426/50501_1 /TAXON_ID=89044 /ORGANISM="Spumella elongata, Strain CCAP 955/1" /LENGTH=72 /DNA_ID=CAMNT_0027520879 /DNA_START=66 /DNA_END=284 /DNA_ORIENTATION=+